MLIFKRIKDIKKHLKPLIGKGKGVGFVPTMGALHAGHISLITSSKSECKVTVCSIFVNPTQFNDQSDFDKYPVTIDKDLEMLSDAGCDILFLPTVKEMYPEGFSDAKAVDFGFLAETLEGEHRPGHFGGMAQIVEKLLLAVKPDRLYMGQKDYQQQLIVRALIKKRKLNTKLVTIATMREKDGLAMSSRNVRLDKEARKLAVELSKALKGVKKEIGKTDVRHKTVDIRLIKEKATKKLSAKNGIELEYFEIRNAETLKPPTGKKEKLVALVAAKIGGVRLIDNMKLN